MVARSSEPSPSCSASRWAAVRLVDGAYDPYFEFKGGHVLANMSFEELYAGVAAAHGRAITVFRERLAQRGSLDPNNDIRITTFGKLGCALANANLGTAMVAQHLQYKGWWDTYAGGLRADERQQMLDEFVNMLRRVLVHDSFSAIESSLRVLLKELDPTAAGGGVGEFKNVYECLLRSKLSRQYLAECQLLDLMRLVRNTVHNNGVYLPKSGREEIIQWKGATYTFTPGVAVLFVKWEFLFDRLGELVLLCKDVLTDPSVVGIAHTITDPAVSQMPQALRF